MRVHPTIVSTAAAFTIVLGVGVALAESGSPSSGAPSESDISNSLAPRGRGLPTLGTLPSAPPSPAVAPASTAPAPPASSSPATRATRVSTPPHAGSPPPPSETSPSITLRTIQFQFGSAQLTPDSVQTLKNLGNALNNELKDQAHFVIEGHTDAYGEARYNAELSKERAEAVKDYLVKEMGVADGRLEAVGKGSGEPVRGSSPYAAINRRVVVINSGA
jgi:outer membrane protein OmpA-like peptidoglycan-associated protein